MVKTFISKQILTYRRSGGSLSHSSRGHAQQQTQPRRGRCLESWSSWPMPIRRQTSEWSCSRVAAACSPCRDRISASATSFTARACPRLDARAATASAMSRAPSPVPARSRSTLRCAASSARRAPPRARSEQLDARHARSSPPTLSSSTLLVDCLLDSTPQRSRAPVSVAASVCLAAECRLLIF